MASGEERPVLSEKRVTEIRALLAENFKKLKKAYSDAVKPTSDSEAKAVANGWLERMWGSVGSAKKWVRCGDNKRGVCSK